MRWVVRECRFRFRTVHWDEAIFAAAFAAYCCALDAAVNDEASDERQSVCAERSNEAEEVEPGHHAAVVRFCFFADVCAAALSTVVFHGHFPSARIIPFWRLGVFGKIKNIKIPPCGSSVTYAIIRGVETDSGLGEMRKVENESYWIRECARKSNQ